MSDTFVERETTGFLSNMGRSIMAVPIGILLFLLSFVVFWMTEGRTDWSKVAGASVVASADAASDDDEGEEDDDDDEGVMSSDQADSDSAMISSSTSPNNDNDDDKQSNHNGLARPKRRRRRRPQARIFSPTLTINYEFKTNAVRVELNTANNRAWSHIDCVRLRGGTQSPNTGFFAGNKWE